MTRNQFTGALALLVFVGSVAIVRADSFDDVEKKLDAASKSVKSMQMKSSMETKMAQQGFEMTSTTTGMYWHKRDGDKVMMRMEGDSKTVQNIGGMKQETTQKTLMVSDGDIIYTLSETDGNKMVMKNKAQADTQPWSAAKADNEFKVLPDESVDGADCYVFEATPKNKEAGDQSHTTYYCRKDCGFPVKMMAYGPDGQVMTTMTYTDIKLNVDIPADKFEFEPPAGVQVMDMTGA